MLADANVTVILEYAETLLPAAELPMMSPDDRNLLVTLLRWGTDPALNAAGNFAFLLVQNLTDLHPALRAGSSATTPSKCLCPTARPARLHRLVSGNAAYRSPNSERMNSPTSPPACR